MVRKGVLASLLAAAALLVLVGFAFFVMPFAFLRPCPTGPEDHGSSPAPAGGEEALTCLRVPLAVPLGIASVFGFLAGRACARCYKRFADDGGDEEKDEASGAAKKAGYVAVAAADDPEAGAGAGAKS